MVTFTRHFLHYLLGRRFITRTDMTIAVWFGFLTSRIPKARLRDGWKSWASIIWTFDTDLGLSILMPMLFLGCLVYISANITRLGKVLKTCPVGDANIVSECINNGQTSHLLSMTPCIWQRSMMILHPLHARHPKMITEVKHWSRPPQILVYWENA